MTRNTGTTSNTPFLNELDAAQKKAGIFLIDKFLSDADSESAFSVLDSKAFPWDEKPKLYGQSIPQHGHFYGRGAKSQKHSSMAGIEKLEEISQQIERRFDGKITGVFCNRFQDPHHHIEWHKDTYGQHIFVLSLGSTRRIEFRDNKTKQVEAFVPQSGDLYFMPLKLNYTHQHRVLTPEGVNAGTRLSFVFFFEPPAYATDYKLSMRDRMKGAWESLVA